MASILALETVLNTFFFIISVTVLFAFHVYAGRGSNATSTPLDASAELAAFFERFEQGPEAMTVMDAVLFLAISIMGFEFTDALTWNWGSTLVRRWE